MLSECDWQAEAKTHWSCGVSTLTALEITVNRFKCQILLTNYSINKRSSLELAEIFQIYLLVLEGWFFFFFFWSTQYLPFYCEDFPTFPNATLPNAIICSYSPLCYTKCIVYPLTHTANPNLGKCVSHRLVCFVSLSMLCQVPLTLNTHQKHCILLFWKKWNPEDMMGMPICPSLLLCHSVNGTFFVKLISRNVVFLVAIVRKTLLPLTHWSLNINFASSHLSKVSYYV